MPLCSPSVPKCPACNGKCYVGATGDPCRACEGSGVADDATTPCWCCGKDTLLNRHGFCFKCEEDQQ